MTCLIIRDGHEWLFCVRDITSGEWAVRIRCGDKASAVRAKARWEARCPKT